MQIVPQIFKKIPLSIHQNTPFQAKKIAIFSGLSQWTSFLAPTKSSGSATAYPAEFHQRDFRPWKTRGVLVLLLGPTAVSTTTTRLTATVVVPTFDRARLIILTDAVHSVGVD